MKRVSGKLILFLMLLGVVFTSCNKADKTTTDGIFELDGVTVDKPLKIDVENGVITVLARVNGKFFTNPTRHAVVCKDGKFGNKSVYASLANQNDFYDALIKLGGQAGNNMFVETATTTHVEGDKINIKINWKGSNKRYDISETIIDSNGKPFDFRFGGNQEVAKKMNTGCLICLDSCPVGITSNSTYTYGSVEKSHTVEFYGDDDVLPEDGTFVSVQVSLNK